jgi:hypothetical protein
MRVANPYPFGHAPANRDTSQALERASRAVLRDQGGAKRGEQTGSAVGELAVLLRVREAEPPFDQQYIQPWAIELEAEQGHRRS